MFGRLEAIEYSVIAKKLHADQASIKLLENQAYASLSGHALFKNLFNKKSYSQALKDKIIIGISPKKHRKPLGIIAVILLVLLTIRYGDEIGTFAEKSSLVQDMKVVDVEPEEDFEYELPKNKVIESFEAFQGDYTVHVMDKTCDDKRVGYSFAVEDKDGNFLTELEYQMKITGQKTDFQKASVLASDPWYDCFLPKTNTISTYNIMTFRLELLIDGDLYQYSPVYLTVNESNYSKVGDQDLMFTIEEDNISVLIRSIVTFSNRIDVNYSYTTEDENVENVSIFSAYVKDDIGNTYHSMSMRGMNDLFTMEIDILDFDTVNRDYTFILDKISVNRTKSIGSFVNNQLVYDDGTDIFTLSLEHIEGPDYKITVHSDKERSSYDFPNLVVQTGTSYWQQLEREDIEYLSIDKAFFEDLLGEDFGITPENIKIFHKKLVELTSEEYNYEVAESMLMHFEEYGQFSIRLNAAVLVDHVVFKYRTHNMEADIFAVRSYDNIKITPVEIEIDPGQ